MKPSESTTDRTPGISAAQAYLRRQQDGLTAGEFFAVVVLVPVLAATIFIVGGAA